MNADVHYFQIASTLSNVCGILQRAEEGDDLRFHFDELQGQVVTASGEVFQEYHRVVTQKLLEERFSWVKSPPCAKTVTDAIIYAAMQSRRDPVKEYLQGLTWDKIPRIHNLLTGYMGASARNKALRQAQSSSIMLSAVGRVLSPGTKVDTMPVLVGRQGLGKSSAIRALVPNADWFSDTPIDLRSKDAYISLDGKWIIEVAEMQSMISQSHASQKAFLTSQSDTYRRPYAKTAISHKRRSIFIGTSNDLQLTDSTGSRRFWPIVMKDKPDLKKLVDDRDQLWAEAFARWCVDGTHFNADIEATAEYQEEKELFGTYDPWEDIIVDYWSRHRAAFPLERLFEHMDIKQRERTKSQQLRLTRLLKAQGFVKTRKRGQGKRQYLWSKS
tara:strand:+ start:1147 stop:2304 length:1158 start_codon:yes stop_codon:yes gene_type:complete